MGSLLPGWDRKLPEHFVDTPSGNLRVAVERARAQHELEDPQVDRGYQRSATGPETRRKHRHPAHRRHSSDSARGFAASSSLPPSDSGGRGSLDGIKQQYNPKSSRSWKQYLFSSSSSQSRGKQPAVEETPEGWCAPSRILASDAGPSHPYYDHHHAPPAAYIPPHTSSHLYTTSGARSPPTSPTTIPAFRGYPSSAASHAGAVSSRRAASGEEDWLWVDSPTMVPYTYASSEGTAEAPLLAPLLSGDQPSSTSRAQHEIEAGSPTPGICTGGPALRTVSDGRVEKFSVQSQRRYYDLVYGVESPSRARDHEGSSLDQVRATLQELVLTDAERVHRPSPDTTVPWASMGKMKISEFAETLPENFGFWDASAPPTAATEGPLQDSESESESSDEAGDEDRLAVKAPPDWWRKTPMGFLNEAMPEDTTSPPRGQSCPSSFKPMLPLSAGADGQWAREYEPAITQPWHEPDTP